MTKETTEIIVNVGPRPTVPYISSIEDKSAGNILTLFWPFYRKYDIGVFDYYDKKIFKAAILLVKLGMGSAEYVSDNGRIWKLESGITVAVVDDDGYLSVQPLFGYEDYFSQFTEAADEIE